MREILIFHHFITSNINNCETGVSSTPISPHRVIVHVHEYFINRRVSIFFTHYSLFMNYIFSSPQMRRFLSVIVLVVFLHSLASSLSFVNAAEKSERIQNKHWFPCLYHCPIYLCAILEKKDISTDGQTDRRTDGQTRRMDTLHWTEEHKEHTEIAI